MTQSPLYDRDFLLWTEQQAKCLKRGHLAELDVEHLVKELEALGRSEQRELGSYLQLLLMHLLKSKYQPDCRTKTWEDTIANCQDQIQDCLEDTPSLERFLQDSAWIEKHYRRARRDAAKETQQPIDTFPIDCPFAIGNVLGDRC